MMTVRRIAKEADTAQERGVVYGLLANALRYPDDALLSALADPAKWPSWTQPIAEIDVETGKHRDALRQRVPSLVGRQEEMQETFVRLFGHTVRGTCPPYELEYGPSEILQQANELADIAGFYSAFGMELSDAAHERADHVAVEGEFMSVLAAKEAYAIRNRDDGGLHVVRHAQRSFLADHLGRWLPAFAHRLQEADPAGFYGAIGTLAASFIAAECRRCHVPCGPQYLQLRPVDPSRDAAITCGVEPSCPDTQGDSLVQLRLDPGLGKAYS